MTTNLCAVLYAPKTIRFESRSIDDETIGDRDLLIEIDTVGICGTDVNCWRGNRSTFNAPLVLGHEPSGRVIKLGKLVKNFAIGEYQYQCLSSMMHIFGDRIAIDPAIPCEGCHACKSGRYNLCIDVRYAAAPPVDGTLACYYVHPARCCHRLPDHISMEDGALLQPLCVAIYACRRANIQIGQSVLIVGAGTFHSLQIALNNHLGPIGLMNMLVAKAMGAQVIVVDILEHRLEFAQRIGANYVLLADRSSTSESTAKDIRKIYPKGCDASIECSGDEHAMQTGLMATASGGVLVQVGCCTATSHLPIFDNVLCREVDIRGSYRFTNCYPTAIDLVASGKIDLKSLITHRYSLNQVDNAFEMAESRCGMKVIVNCRSSI